MSITITEKNSENNNKSEEEQFSTIDDKSSGNQAIESQENASGTEPSESIENTQDESIIFDKNVTLDFASIPTNVNFAFEPASYSQATENLPSQNENILQKVAQDTFTTAQILLSSPEAAGRFALETGRYVVMATAATAAFTLAPFTGGASVAVGLGLAGLAGGLTHAGTAVGVNMVSTALGGDIRYETIGNEFATGFICGAFVPLSCANPVLNMAIDPSAEVLAGLVTGDLATFGDVASTFVGELLFDGILGGTTKIAIYTNKNIKPEFENIAEIITNRTTQTLDQITKEFASSFASPQTSKLQFSHAYPKGFITPDTPQTPQQHLMMSTGKYDGETNANNQDSHIYISSNNLAGYIPTSKPLEAIDWEQVDLTKRNRIPTTEFDSTKLQVTDRTHERRGVLLTSDYVYKYLATEELEQIVKMAYVIDRFGLSIRMPRVLTDIANLPNTNRQIAQTHFDEISGVRHNNTAYTWSGKYGEVIPVIQDRLPGLSLSDFIVDGLYKRNRLDFQLSLLQFIGDVIRMNAFASHGDLHSSNVRVLPRKSSNIPDAVIFGTIDPNMSQARDLDSLISWYIEHREEPTFNDLKTNFKTPSLDLNIIMFDLKDYMQASDTHFRNAVIVEIWQAFEDVYNLKK